MKNHKRVQFTAERGGWSKQTFWVGHRKPNSLACCHCGLVHNIVAGIYRPVRKNGRIVGYRLIKGGKAGLKFQVNHRATAAGRRAKKLTAVKKAPKSRREKHPHRRKAGGILRP